MNSGMERCVDRRWRLFIRLTAAALLGAAVWMAILAIRFSGPDSPEFGRIWPLEWASVQGTRLSLPNDVEAAPGEPVYMELTLPHGFSALCLRSTQQTVEAYLDGRLIYEYEDKLPMVKAPPSHWNLVDLPAECGGRVLTLVLTSPYQGFSGRINQPFLGSRADLVQFLHARSLPVLIISFVLLVAGAFLLLYSAVTRRSLPGGANACLGTCLLIFAFWSLTECQSQTVFVGTEEVNTLLSFLTVMVFPLPFLLYVRCVSGPRFLRWTDGLFLAAGLLLLCGAILQITGILDLLEIRGASYGFLLLTLLYSAVVFWLEHRRWPEGVVKLQLIGIVLFLFFVLIDLYVEYCTDGFLVSGMFSRTGITLFVFTLALMAQRLRLAELLHGLEQDKQTALMERQIAAAEERLRQMNENMALMRQYRHDMRHQLLLLTGLAEQGKLDLLKAQLKRMTGALEFPVARRYCRDEMLDIVLTAYLERAERLNAAVSYNIRLDEELSQWGTDLNVILANALENAVRALGEAQEPRRLSVRLVADGRRLVLQVKNSSCPVPFNSEGLPLRESGEPGIGSRSILRIVEQHHGTASYSYDYKDEMFLLNAVIPYN